jgi:ATP-dependent exoDNAse (exonuclease V) alpha subunit
MLLNFTNHPSAGWSEKQINAALDTYESIEDLPFPRIDPMDDEEELKELAKKYLTEIKDKNPTAVHIMGEMNFTFIMVNYLTNAGIACIASTTERDVETLSDGSLRTVFNFVGFRKYLQLLEKDVEAFQEEFELTSGQASALEKMKNFAADQDLNIFILKGYAGTGKTTLVRHFLKECSKLNKSVTLLATTGRAASILKAKSGVEATTMHSLIYRFNEIQSTNGSNWEDNMNQVFYHFKSIQVDEANAADIYVVDEASMISGVTFEGINDAKFGTGNTLNDFFQAIGKGKIVFVGDPCQLPPVDIESFPIALSSEMMRKRYPTKKIDEAELTEIVRQAENSQILEIAAPIRKAIVEKQVEQFPKLMIKRGVPDIVITSTTSQLIADYLKVVNKNGVENAIVLAHKNDQVFSNNVIIRKSLFPGQSRVQVGDLLMVIKNDTITKLRNGDQVKVVELGVEETIAGCKFINVKVKNIFNNEIFTTKLIEDTLYMAIGDLTADKNKALIIDFDKRMRDKTFKRNSELYKDAMRSDPYINGLRTNFGYSITLHKAQGGEWQHVFLDLDTSVYVASYNGKPMDVLKWLYTAVTRTQRLLNVKNCPVLKIT